MRTDQILLLRYTATPLGRFACPQLDNHNKSVASLYVEENDAKRARERILKNKTGNFTYYYYYVQ